MEAARDRMIKKEKDFVFSSQHSIYTRLDQVYRHARISHLESRITYLDPS